MQQYREGDCVLDFKDILFGILDSGNTMSGLFSPRWKDD